MPASPVSTAEGIPAKAPPPGIPAKVPPQTHQPRHRRPWARCSSGREWRTRATWACRLSPRHLRHPL
eukprot:7662667-Alexandrium_andersonii.AAC.1